MLFTNQVGNTESISKCSSLEVAAHESGNDSRDAIVEDSQHSGTMARTPSFGDGPQFPTAIRLVEWQAVKCATAARLTLSLDLKLPAPIPIELLKIPIAMAATCCCS